MYTYQIMVHDIEVTWAIGIDMNISRAFFTDDALKYRYAVDYFRRRRTTNTYTYCMFIKVVSIEELPSLKKVIEEIVDEYNTKTDKYYSLGKARVT